VAVRTLSATSTVHFGRYLVNTAGSGSTFVTSTSGDHATIANATLVSGTTTISGFSVTGNGALYNGTNTTGTPTGSVTLSQNFGAFTGIQSGSIMLTEANSALQGEFVGGVNPFTVNYTANPVAPRTLTASSTVDFGRYLQNN